MMGLYQSFSGTLRVRLLSGDVANSLQTLEQAKISVFAVRAVDAVTLEFTVSRGNLTALQQICQRKGYVLQIVKKEGLFWPLRALLTRPILLISMILLVLAASYVPGRILFVTTEGNESLPTRYILEQAEQCGLHFLASRRDVRSEQIKNMLLESIPQLQWVGVNTYGCRAVITVRERAPTAPEVMGSSVSHVVAARDGVVHSCTVTHGCRNTTVGQAVRKGDVLISGYTDCGLIVTAERAEGEVFAQTKRSISVTMPLKGKIQSETDRSNTRFSLLIGKKRINFYKGSGISGASCDKMYSKYVLTLPGGFALPVALLKEYTVSCTLTEAVTDVPKQFLENFASEYLLDQMEDGVILRRSEQITQTSDTVNLSGTYDCLEQIGIVQDEVIGEFHGKTDGTDRERGSGG